jgi:hypothetical protein
MSAYGLCVWEKYKTVQRDKIDTKKMLGEVKIDRWDMPLTFAIFSLHLTKME